ncbi:hypothetical protein D3C83_64010 [compost metagenome]
MHFSRVVLPMPLRPMRHVREPGGTSRSTSHSVRLPPYDWLSAVTRSGIMRPLILAPMQRWPTSVWIA